MSRKRKKRKKKRASGSGRTYRRPEGEKLVRGRSKREDFLLDLTAYVQRHLEYHGTHPFEGLDEDQKEVLIDTLIMLNASKRVDDLPSLPSLREDPDGFHETVQKFVESVKTGENRTVDIPHATEHNTGEIEEVLDKTREKIRQIVDLSPLSRKRLPDDLGDYSVMSTRNRRKLLIENYLNTVEMFRQGGDGIGVKYTDEDEHPEAKQLSREMASISWSLAREAHIFDIPFSLASVLYHQVDLHLCRMAGVKWVHPTSKFKIPDKDVAHYTEVVKRERVLQTLPENLPFESMFFGITPPLTLNSTQKMLWGVNPKLMDEHTQLYGFLVTSNLVATLIMQNTLFAPKWEMTEGQWLPDSLTSTPWWVPWIIDWINDHQTVVEESTKSFSYRTDYKRSAKGKIPKPIPPPYYTVLMQDKKIEEDDWLKRLQKRSRAIARKKCQHQFDVRGHWCVRVARGPLPLAPKMEARLRKNKHRKLFIMDSPDAETAAHLAKRGFASKRVDEWMSVLVYWRDDHRRGPEDGPYIPSIRSSGRKEIVDAMGRKGRDVDLRGAEEHRSSNPP
jgi:hypothetical protein